MTYRIYRLKETQRESFRWAAHTGGTATVKTRDYDCAGEIEAATPYAAWKQLSTAEQPLRPGDLVEVVRADGTHGDLQIAKYIGFEKAEWFVPEPKFDASVGIPVNSV